jgi:hypothetical protein
MSCSKFPRSKFSYHAFSLLSISKPAVHRLLCCLIGLSGMAAASAQSDSPLNRPPQPPSDSPQPVAGMGIMAGSVTDSSALIQVRLTEGDKLVDGDLRGAWGVVEFDLAPTAGVQVMIAHA